jgi:hypothetical protein
MTLSFQRSADCIFERNILIAPGKISIVQPNGFKIWKDNIIFRNGKVINNMLQSLAIDSAMPAYSIPLRMTQVAKVVKVSKAPVLDGSIAAIEWPGEFYTLDREPSRLPASGAPVLVKLSYNNKYIYLGANVTMFDPANISKGTIWGKDDGLEVSIAGKTSKGRPAIFLVRLFADGTVQSLTLAGADEESAKHLEKELRFFTVIKPKQRNGGGWNCELAIPFDVLGLKPASGMKIAFNMCAFCNEYGKWHCWEGTRGESWNLDQAGILQLQ